MCLVGKVVGMLDYTIGIWLSGGQGVCVCVCVGDSLSTRRSGVLESLFGLYGVFADCVR